MATIVALPAHPDDEVLWTGGTLAQLAGNGHRVVLVLACSVPMDGPGARGSERLDQLRDSCAILGVQRVVHLGYADSGHGPILCPDPPGAVRFARADLAEAAGRLADVLREESADLLLSYDEHGGNGHADHVNVHQVGARAAGLTDTRVLEATMPRELVAVLARPLRLARLVVRYDKGELEERFTPRRRITHRVQVRRQAARKQAALAAHTSHASARGRTARLGRLLLVLPVPIFGLVLGREWFAEPGAVRPPVSGDVLQPASMGTWGASG